MYEQISDSKTPKVLGPLTGGAGQCGGASNLTLTQILERPAPCPPAPEDEDAQFGFSVSKTKTKTKTGKKTKKTKKESTPAPLGIGCPLCDRHVNT